MKEIKSEQIKSIVQKNRQNIIIWSVVTVCSIIIFGLSFFMQDYGQSTSLHEMIAAGEDAEDKLVHIEVSEKPYVFAYYPDDYSGKFYFLWDENYMYVAFLSQEEFNKLNVDGIKENHISVKGVTKKIPEDIKKLALEAYNENVDEENQIASSEFADYFGLIYLDETGYSTVSVICLILGIFLYFLGFIMLISQIIVKVKFNRHRKKLSAEDWDELNKELDDEKSFYYKGAKLALTENYVVDFSKGLQIIKYKDIIWMYRYEYRYRGVKTEVSIILYTIDKKRHVIASLPGYTKKNKEINEEIMKTIAEKNKNMLIGYNKENRKQIKEEYQIKA